MPVNFRISASILAYIAQICIYCAKEPQPLQRGEGYQPCFCLCLGFSQMIITRPLRLITLHFSQMGFTEGLTFMVLPPYFIQSLSSSNAR